VVFSNARTVVIYSLVTVDLPEKSFTNCFPCREFSYLRKGLNECEKGNNDDDDDDEICPILASMCFSPSFSTDYSANLPASLQTKRVRIYH